jgi:hypothetical protein
MILAFVPSIFYVPITVAPSGNVTTGSDNRPFAGFNVWYVGILGYFVSVFNVCRLTRRGSNTIPLLLPNILGLTAT